MAMIKTDLFERIEKNRNSIHKPTNATYTVFSVDEKRIFQIDTYGSPDRVMPEKISQTIQMDKEMAKVLVKLLRQEFDIN